jgi:hypothetical protein
MEAALPRLAAATTEHIGVAAAMKPVCFSQTKGVLTERLSLKTRTNVVPSAANNPVAVGNSITNCPALVVVAEGVKVRSRKVNVFAQDAPRLAERVVKSVPHKGCHTFVNSCTVAPESVTLIIHSVAAG